ncbi:hypothetical protein [Dactylosporangium salmoneum]|uniref:Lipoprotein n=1 Tax=Dactylosporangium salmoneum TaxID=53361 RepID=A0ABP5UIH3_9ACTN
MKRTLAIALAAGLLFLGGCGKAKAPEPAAPPAATTNAPAAERPNTGANQKDDGVDGMLDQVGQQLSNDDQPADDED